jgi:hypothetical protein
MNRKEIKFAKNAGLAIAGAVAGGLAGAELSDILTDSKAVIAFSSTAGQYLASLAVFCPLHARDNRDLYQTNGSFGWQAFGKDIGKLTGGFVLLDAAYFVGRPSLNYYFQRKGHDPIAASLLTDSVFVSVYALLAMPMAKRFGLIRENGNCISQ